MKRGAMRAASEGFLPWKTEQIAQNTWNEGDNDGTEQFVEDAKKSGTDHSMMRVRVLPGPYGAYGILKQSLGTNGDKR